MTLPGLATTILDGALGIVTPASSVPHLFGVASSGAFDTPTTIGNERQLRAVFGFKGPLIDEATYVLQNAGGPILVTRVHASVAATIGSITKSGAGPIIANDASTPNNSYNVIITISKAGTLSTAEYVYSLDGDLTRTGPTGFVSDANITLADTGINLTMAAGTYVLGETYTFATVSAHYNSSDLATFYAAVTQSSLKFDFFSACGQPIDGDDGATLFATHESNINALINNKGRFYALIENSGADSAAQVLTDYIASTSLRQVVAFGTAVGPAPGGILGRGFATLPISCLATYLATANVISTDLMKTSGASTVGVLPGIISISQDEFLNPAGLDAAKITTTRTYTDLDGFFLSNVWLRSPVGSDFQYFQHRRIMDEAVKTVNQQHSLLLGSNFACKADGTGSLTEGSAQSIEKRVQRALDNVIGSANRVVGPARIDGNIGHVSDQRYQVDRTNNVISTNTIIATVSIVPLGYAKIFQTTFSFSLQTA